MRSAEQNASVSSTPESRPPVAPNHEKVSSAGTGARLNVNINARTADELRRIAKRSGITYTEAVRRAVEVLAFVMDERDAGNAVQVYEPTRNITKELITL